MKIEIKVGESPHVDADDWCHILARMYRCFLARHEVAVVETETVGSITLEWVESPPLVRALRAEIGVHRLVRLSPFDALCRRHTSFASVSVDGLTEESQRRSYILHPYTRAKDHGGADIDLPDVHAVLDGHLEPFLGIP